jgi:hypothetical protein
MKVRKLAVLIVALALGVVPALAMASGSSKVASGKPATTPGGPPSTTPAGPPAGIPPANERTEHKPSTPGPTASLPAKAKAYGRFCKGQSKTHVAGTPGTAFSKCVTGMAKLATGSVTTPLAACKGESKKHVAGEHGTAFSHCVSGAAKLLESEHSS